MNAKGGYQIVDLKNTNLTAGTAATIPGIYDAIEGNYRKPVLLAGIQIGSTEYPDAFITPTVSSDDYVFNAYGYNFTVTDDDEITAVAAAIVPVSGTNDGTNWTKINIGGTEKAIPSGS